MGVTEPTVDIDLVNFKLYCPCEQYQMTFSVVCAEAMANKEAALVLDCGDETQQVQDQKNEGANNLPAGTALIKAPSLTAGGQ